MFGEHLIEKPTELKTFDFIVQRIGLFENYIRFIAISIAIYEDKDNLSDKESKMLTPWDNSYYSSKGHFKTFKTNQLPRWLSANKLIHSLNTSTNIFKIKKFAEKVFAHLRKFDGVDDILNSLNPDLNIDVIKKAEGGRSGSEVIFTYDKKYLIKRIPKDEKISLMNMLSSFHHFMITSQSLLCKIYGLYNITVNSFSEYFILMKNMNELPLEVILFNKD